jgi:hypothetical protein
MRKSCKECPYKVKSQHNHKFPQYVDKMFNSGLITSKKHTCHMIGNVWDKPAEKTVCIGSINN